MLARVFLCLAALLEGLVLPYLLLADRYNGDWIGLLILHLMISLAVGLLGKESLPKKYQRLPRMVVLFLVALTMFIPMLGAIGVLSIVLMTNYFLARKEETAIQELQESRFAGTGQAEMIQYGSGDLKSRFAAPALRTEARLDALGKLQGFETQQITTTVREALQDQADDIRLVAFGILDKKEKAINEKINQELEWFELAVEEYDKLTHARQLSYAYWELVYKEVVEGDILTYALERATHFNAVVLATQPQDAGMWALKGQIALRSHNSEQAREAFTKALEYGIPETRVVPYLAELAFLRKEFSELSNLFRRSQTLSQVAILNPILKYWDREQRLVQEYAPT